MTPLETLIEEEKKKARTETQSHCQKGYEGILQQEVIDGTVSYWGKRTDTLLTSAMPRAYKAGRADWLRSEIERLETFSKMVPNLSVVDTIGRKLDDSFGYKSSVLIGYQSALTTLITRYKEELKELESK